MYYPPSTHAQERGGTHAQERGGTRVLVRPTERLDISPVAAHWLIDIGRRLRSFPTAGGTVKAPPISSARAQELRLARVGEQVEGP